MFYLHMSGEGAGTLSVYMITKSSISLLLNLTGYQGNYWIRQEVPLFSKEHFQVMLEGKMGQTERGDISIDDITFSPGCLFNHHKTNLPDPPSTGMFFFVLLAQEELLPSALFTQMTCTVNWKPSWSISVQSRNAFEFFLIKRMCIPLQLLSLNLWLSPIIIPFPSHCNI